VKAEAQSRKEHATMPVVVNGDPTGLPTGDTRTRAEDEEPFVLGIDEAGRGAALGPMTYGVAWCPVAKKEQMAKLGFMGEQ
jgi:ribonuclease HIII